MMVLLLLRSISAIIIAPILNNNGVDARLSFLPRRYNRFALGTVQPTTTRCIIDLRGGSTFDDDANRNIVEDDAADSNNADEHSREPWEEEIRRTRAFYNTPRLSSQTDHKILITGKQTASTPPAASENNDEDIGGVVGEDERAFGSSAQATSYSVQDNEAADTSEQTSELERVASDVAERDIGETLVIEDEEEVTQQPVESTEEVAAEESSNYEINASGETNIQGSTDSQHESDALNDSNEIVEEGEAASEEEDGSGVKDNDAGVQVNNEESITRIDKNEGEEKSEVVSEEDSSGVELMEEREAEADDSVVDESDNPIATQDETIDMDKNDELDESVVEAEDKKDHLEEDSLNSSAKQEVISPGTKVDIKEEDLHRPHRWEKATKATASNKLVEEGLRRLQRRDGDVPSVPYVITRAMQRVLVEELGYDPSEVKVMRPDVAVVIVGEGLERPELDTLPDRFYSYVDSEVDVAVEEISDDNKSLKGAAVIVLNRIKKWILDTLADIPEKLMPILVASLGVTLSILSSSKRDKDSGVGTGGTTMPILSSDIPSSIIVEAPLGASGELSDIEDDFDKYEDGDSAPSSTPALQPDDLDKTWLDKIISFVSATISGTS